MNLVAPVNDSQWEEARRLVDEYAQSLGIDLGFQDYEHEVASLRVEYGPPGGGFVLAERDGVFVGCGGFRPLAAPSICEMKRLYVGPVGRGQGIGRAIAKHLIDAARGRGYAAMRLDTLPTMAAARRMYAELGFREIAPYRYNPVAGTTFLELAL